MQGRGPEVLTDERLMEQNFGIFEGMTHQEILERYPEEYAAWNRDFDNWRIPGGECFSDVRSRVDAFVKDLPGEGTVLVAAHKGTLGHLTASLLHLPLEGYTNTHSDAGAVHFSRESSLWWPDLLRYPPGPPSSDYTTNSVSSEHNLWEQHCMLLL
jgi:broad specificity phosphatase PhoE